MFRVGNVGAGVGESEADGGAMNENRSISTSPLVLRKANAHEGVVPKRRKVLRLTQINLPLLLDRLNNTQRNERGETLTVRRRLVEGDAVLAAVVDRDGRDGGRGVVLEVFEGHDAALGLDDCAQRGNQHE